ncbi:hypothetical protein CWI38_1835p0020 [Hamiltosporidium tvaerminnensis]|uniref:Uncharacterized protein n=1 Tax=Hamiltosporidium tvaerminnensis TaxID=1176355 RepID=A0A4Q9LS26_9MICR|nr:hypothetical protein CWI38_1835p0020 [Hamiltosporidium tvaerminnensis]
MCVNIRVLVIEDCKYKGVSIRIVIKGVINMCVNKRVLFIWYLDKRVLLKKDIYKGVNMDITIEIKGLSNTTNK